MQQPQERLHSHTDTIPRWHHLPCANSSIAILPGKASHPQTHMYMHLLCTTHAEHAPAAICKGNAHDVMLPLPLGSFAVLSHVMTL